MPTSPDSGVGVMHKFPSPQDHHIVKHRVATSEVTLEQKSKPSSHRLTRQPMFFIIVSLAIRGPHTGTLFSVQPLVQSSKVKTQDCGKDDGHGRHCDVHAECRDISW